MNKLKLKAVTQKAVEW